MRYIVLSVVLVTFVSIAVQAQSPQLSPQTQQDLQQAQQALQRAQELQTVLQQYQRTVQGGGGRGAVYTVNAGAWWTNAALVTQLGLTDDQKTKIERAYENHRQDLLAGSQQVDKEEAQLAKLLAADPLDKNAVLSEIDRVVQARGDLERTNSAMTLEMREVLTGAQWTKLQSRPGIVGNWLEPGPSVIRTPFGDVVNPGQRNSGQRSGQK